MKLSKKDIAMYVLFFAAIIMFVFLFFVFFKTGDSQTTEHTADISPEVTTLSLTANYSVVNVYNSPTGKAYVTYGQRKTAGSQDEIAVSGSGSRMEIDIKHKQGNATSGLWHSGAPVNIYLPPVNNITLRLDLKTGVINASNASLHQITCKTRASTLKISGGALDRLNYESKAGRLTTDGAKIAIADIDVNIGYFEFLSEAKNDGFTLDSNIGAGLIFSDKSLELTHPNIAIKYSDKIAGVMGANKITLAADAALIRITK